jgi:tetratricopeptide (TPR) repeat protein
MSQISEEQQLLESLNASKKSSQRIQILSDLNSLYKTENLVKQNSILSKLKSELNFVSAKKDRSLIQLIFLEELMIESNLTEFKQIYESNFISIKFQDPNLILRYEVLKMHYAYLFDNGDYLKIARNLVTKTKKSRKNELISEAFKNLSLAYAYKNAPDSALAYGKLATEFALRSNSKTTLALSFRHLSSLYSYFGRNNEAVAKSLEFFQLAKELNNNLLESFANRDIGFILFDAGNLEIAQRYFERAEKLGENYLNEFEKTILKYGQIIASLNQADGIKKSNFYNSIAMFKSAKLKGFMAFTKGKEFVVKKNWQAAIPKFQESISFFRLIKDFQKISHINQELAECYLNLKNYNEAEKCATESVENNLGLSAYSSNENYRLLSEIYAATNRINEAYKFQKMYLENNRKLTISKDAVLINDLTESNLREERERFIENQKQSIEKERKAKEKLEMQRTRNLLISIIVALILVLGLIILYLRSKQIRSQQEQREAEMSQALLRTQMNPHFVFNAMSVIQSYIFSHTPEKSSKFLVNFSKLMRLILENSPKEFIPLELEEEILEKYLNTQKLRFEDRFEFELNFDEELLFQKAMVPPMITQPFVENAIEHGQLHTVENGKIVISAKQMDNMLQIIVSDNGIGRKGSGKTKKIKTHKSMAINMTQERIEILNRKYRSSGDLIIEDNDMKTGRGTIVTILLPLKFEN